MNCARKYLTVFNRKCKWETTHTNRYLISTREVCVNCGKVREVTKRERGNFYWLYDDGTLEPDERVFKHSL